MDCSLTGSCIHGSFQARVLEWGAIAFSVLYHWCSATTFWYVLVQFSFCFLLLLLLFFLLHSWIYRSKIFLKYGKFVRIFPKRIFVYIYFFLFLLLLQVSRGLIFFHRQIISPMDTYGVFIILKEICILWKDLWCLFLVVFTDTFMGRLFKNHTWPQIFTEF